MRNIVAGVIVELLADVLVKLDADFVATRALSLGLAQRVLDALAWQILGQRLAAMSLAFGFAGVGDFFNRRLGAGDAAASVAASGASSGRSQG